jgi:acid phosphatase
MVWAEADLAWAAANRAAVPWIVFAIHRPLYSADAGEFSEHSPGAPMLAAFEPLLLKHRVDLTLTGHMHAYERIHPNVNGSVVAKPVPGPGGSAGSVVYLRPSAPVHLMIGSAGAMQKEKWEDPLPLWSAFHVDTAPLKHATDSYGFGSVAVWNETHLQFRFVPASGTVSDEFWIVR